MSDQPTPYPTLRAAIIEMGYDSGCIGRDLTAELVADSAGSAIRTEYTPAQLLLVEAELSSMTAGQLDELICGEHGAVPCSELCDNVLNTAFDNLVPG